jgi:DNA invertase Pin-like site-specific DNA recombinase
MRVGYARVSGADQNIDAQLARLLDCDKVFFEKQSGSASGRPQLAACLDFVREGDSLVCTRLDRLARSTLHLCQIGETLAVKRVALVVLDQHIDTATPTGKLLFHMLSAIAEFELGIRKEQQRAGIAHARSTGQPTGRPLVLNEKARSEVRELYGYGWTLNAIAKRFRIAKSTVRRYVQDKPGHETTF